jgi:hypothetical protein
MFKIEITDPHTLPQDVLLNTAKYLMSLAGVTLAPLPKPTSGELNNLQGLPHANHSLVVPPLADVASKEYVDNLADFNKALPGAFGVPNLIDEELVPVAKETINPFAKSIIGAVPFQPLKKVDIGTTPQQINNLMDGIELDVNGLPWDTRIHSRTKSKLVDGSWKVQRGVNPAVLDQVTAELRGVIQTPRSKYEPIKPLLDLTPPAPITQPPVDPITEDKNTFPELVNKITALVAAKKLTQEQVVKAVQAEGIPSLALASTYPDRIAKVIANIDMMIR